MKVSWAWWCTLIISSLRRLRQENLKFKAGLDYIVSKKLQMRAVPGVTGLPYYWGKRGFSLHRTFHNVWRLFLVVLGFELRASHLLHRCSTT
jgi:hypothetical protein